MDIFKERFSNLGNQLPTKMNTHKFFSFIIFLSLFSFILSTAEETCSHSFCSRSEPLIRFPFRLNDHQQPKSCGYPGFDLSCGPSYRTTLELPDSGNFTVKAINYATQELWINDPGNCLPQRILSLNLTGSPFTGVYYQDFNLFNCTFDYTKYRRINSIGCLSGTNFTVFATSSPMAIRFFTAKKDCSFVQNIVVPVDWPFYEQVVSSDLSDDLRLSWGEPWCKRCESRGGQCGFKPNSTAEIECHSGPPVHGPKIHNHYIISLAVGGPVLLLLVISIICIICSRSRPRQQQPSRMTEFSATVAPQPMIHPGLDKPTIDSYPKTILGKSCRLPNPDDTICAICLSEYRPKETLRSIPECQHSFHADCIDEWLRVNGSCPVCRNSPPRTSPAAHLVEL